MVATQNGVTALYLFAQESHVKVVRLLLEKGADINIFDNVAVDFLSCNVCGHSVSWLYVTLLYIYVVYREQSVGLLHKHSREIEMRQKANTFHS